MIKDWTGNIQSVHANLGFGKAQREINDYYATEPKAVKLLLEKIKFEGDIWECACGEGHLSKEMIKHGYNVYSTDLINRGYGKVFNFLTQNEVKKNTNIITNPPFKYSCEFIIKGMESIEDHKYLALFMPIRYLEGKARRKIYDKYRIYKVLASSNRICCAKNGNFNLFSGSAMSYAWFVWKKGYNGETILEFIN